MPYAQATSGPSTLRVWRNLSPACFGNNNVAAAVDSDGRSDVVQDDPKNVIAQLSNVQDELTKHNKTVRVVCRDEVKHQAIKNRLWFSSAARSMYVTMRSDAVRAILCDQQ